MDRKALDRLWRQYFPEISPLRSRDLAARKIAWIVQKKAYGGLRAQTRTNINRLISGKIKTPKNKHAVKPGTQLTRSWNGKNYSVQVSAERHFEYNGKTYRSLSAIAKKITGAHWSGPLFFGLK